MVLLACYFDVLLVISNESNALHRYYMLLPIRCYYFIDQFVSSSLRERIVRPLTASAWLRSTICMYVIVFYMVLFQLIHYRLFLRLLVFIFYHKYSYS